MRFVADGCCFVASGPTATTRLAWCARTHGVVGRRLWISSEGWGTIRAMAGPQPASRSAHSNTVPCGCSVSASLITLCCVESVVSAGSARLKRHDRCAQAATKDHTLLRSDAVQRGNGGQWSASAGTSEADSEWIVLESEEWWPVSNRACDDSCGRPPRGDCQGAPQRAVSPRCENIVRPSPLSSLS